VERGFLADLRDPTVLAPLARRSRTRRCNETGCARCSSAALGAFRRTQAQQRQQIGQIDQPFRLCLLIRAEHRPTILLVREASASAVGLRASAARQVPDFDLEVDLRGSCSPGENNRSDLIMATGAPSSALGDAPAPRGGLRFLDAHAYLAGRLLGMSSHWALQQYEVGVGIGRLSVGDDFDGMLRGELAGTAPTSTQRSPITSFRSPT